MNTPLAEWVRWILSVAVIPAGVMIVDLRQTVALQGAEIKTSRQTLTAHIESDHARIDKLVEKHDASNEALIRVNEALATLKERLNDLLEQLRNPPRRR